MATLKVLRPGDEARLERFLSSLVDSSMFLIGNMRMAGLVDRGGRYEGTYVAAFDDGEILGVVAHYWNGNLILQAPVHLQTLWRAAAKASGRSIMGALGPSNQVQVVKDVLRVEDSNVQMDETEGLYSLPLEELIVPAPVLQGESQGRRIQARDLELMTEWQVAYSLEALGAEESPELREGCRTAMERSIQDGSTWLLEVGGRPVACSSFNTAMKEAVQVGGVWTPPELRRRGYGRSVVAVSLMDARAEGVEKAILFTGEDNIPAQKAYLALGFRHIGDYRILLLKSPPDLGELKGV